MYKSIDIPLFIQIEDNALKKIKLILKKANIFINNPIVVTDKGKSSEFAQIIMKELSIRKEMIIYIKENTYEEVKRVEKFARKKKCDFIIGVGGGLALDISKLASFKYGSYFISVPTLPSHDGISSPVASIKVNGKRMSLGASMPMGIIVDLNVIKSVPNRFINSGIMDLLSNHSAIKDWELAYDKGYEVKFNGFAKAIAYSAADSILHYRGTNIKNKEFLHLCINSLVLSGIAMEIAGSSRPASGAEHNFSHAYDSLYPNNKFLHGEKVGIGTLIITKLRNEKDYEILYNVYEKFNLLESLKALNLDLKKITEALLLAKTIRKNRYSLLNEITLNKKRVNKIIKEIFA